MSKAVIDMCVAKARLAGGLSELSGKDLERARKQVRAILGYLRDIPDERAVKAGVKAFTGKGGPADGVRRTWAAIIETLLLED